MSDIHEDAKSNSVLDSAFVKKYEDIFIKVKEWGVFHHSDIERNRIYGYDTRITPP